MKLKIEHSIVLLFLELTTEIIIHPYVLQKNWKLNAKLLITKMLDIQDLWTTRSNTNVADNAVVVRCFPKENLNPFP